MDTNMMISTKKGNGWTKVHTYTYMINRESGKKSSPIDWGRSKEISKVIISIFLFLSLCQLTFYEPYYSSFSSYMLHCSCRMWIGVIYSWCMDSRRLSILIFFFSSFYRRHKWQLMPFNISGIQAIKVYFFLVHQTVASIVRVHLKCICVRVCVCVSILYFR